MQDLGSVFRGFAIAKAPFNSSSGSKEINTYIPELVPLRSPFKVLRAVVAFLSRGPKGLAIDLRGSDPW